MTGQPAQQIQRQRQHFQRHEHGQQVVGGREHQHAADSQHRQREQFGLRRPGAFRFVFGGAVGHRGGLRREGVQARGGVDSRCRGARARGRVVASVTLGEEEDGQYRDQQDGALQDQGGAVDRERIEHGAAARGSSCRPTTTTATNAAIRPPSARRTCVP